MLASILSGLVLPVGAVAAPARVGRPRTCLQAGRQCMRIAIIIKAPRTVNTPISVQGSPSLELTPPDCGQPPTGSCPPSVTISGNLTIGVADNGSQSHGFVVHLGPASLSSSPGTPPGEQFTLDGSAFTIGIVHPSLTACFAAACAAIAPLSSALGQSLLNPVTVANQCTPPFPDGNGLYTVAVGFTVTMSGQQAETFLAFPTITQMFISVDETGTTSC